MVGDHRAMTPVSPEEMWSIGDSSLNRVPAFVLGNAELPKGEIDGAFQQTDLIPSILQLVLKESCLANWQGTMFSSPPTPPRDVIYMHPGNAIRCRSFRTVPLTRLSLMATGLAGSAPPPQTLKNSEGKLSYSACRPTLIGRAKGSPPVSRACL